LRPDDKIFLSSQIRFFSTSFWKIQKMDIYKCPKSKIQKNFPNENFNILYNKLEKQLKAAKYNKLEKLLKAEWRNFVKAEWRNFVKTEWRNLLRQIRG